MYFGNASSVLEYDGVKWRSIYVSNNSLVRSIAIDSNGVVYIGAVGEFGFLEPDEKGNMTYHSLVDKLPAEEREFADVWKTYATPEGIYFQTFSKLIRVKDASVKIWKPETSFHFSYFLDNKLFIIERERGLKCVHKNELSMVHGGEMFSGLRIYAMLRAGSENILIATREKGLFLMNTKANADSAFKPLVAEINDHLIEDQVYGGTNISGGKFAFATLKKGVFIIDQKGDILQVLDKKVGLQDDIVKCVATDNQNDLWIALGTGISRAEISSPLSTLTDAQGLNGFVQDIIKHNRLIYVATSLGLYVGNKDRFEAVSGINSQTWSLERFAVGPDTLLIASSDAGVFQIENKTSKLLQEGIGYFLSQSKSDPARLYIGRNDGFSSIRYSNKHWVDEDYFNGIDKEIRSIAEDKNGDLWLGTPFDGLIRVEFKEKRSDKDTLMTSWKKYYALNHYDTINGLPNAKYNIPYCFDGQVIFATMEGFYEFNGSNKTFNPLHFLEAELRAHQVYRFAYRNVSEVWLVTVAPGGRKETGVAYLKERTYSWFTQPFLKISDREIHAIFLDENDLTWLGGPDGLLHYDAAIKKDFSQPFHALVRTVVIGKDSIFQGTFYSLRDSLRIPELTQANAMIPELAYGENSAAFEYSAANYGDEKNMLFSIYLEGNDKKWSDWTTKTSKEYTNLDEGSYIFHVKAKNIYGTESIEATYAFTILPPWYRTTWAYIIYVVSFIGFVYLIIRLSIRRLVKAKIKLEGIIKERTAEVVEQKHMIEEKQKEIIDSINYAQRIQRALLASDKLLNENLSQYFVFFQPKDIVSGDFYWATKLTNGQFALVTADSTGHGVPGAIMSMLNISCLIEATTGQKLNDPNEILNYARAKIIGHLANDGSAEGGKDGMDCSLVSFDFTNNKMTYAAANNPVWVVRNNEILEFDPDKMPVGKHDRDKTSFTQHVVDLQKNDVVYALTDGMPDQFGGPKGKKFMYKKLKDLFVSVSSFPMNEQKERIRAALNEWKGDLEQVDDVCIIGVRI